MAQLSAHFGQADGRVKPMHATNNGPVVRLRDIKNGTLHPFNNNLEEFKAAGIPYARTHDSSFYHRYGQEHTVDVYYVFPDFNADPTDPSNYDFTCTDQYLQGCYLANTKVFYRLGHRIEHEVKKYGTLPPKDFKKWAVICEHIIRHYTEGWANGFHMDMEYWEIWNEPDLHWDEAPENRPTWGGSPEEFFEFYHVAATHLKTCFPHLKIGGPALAGRLEWAEAFLKQLKAPLDFFSWHRYSSTTEKILKMSEDIDTLLKKYGFTNTESILNEWSYVRGWRGDEMVYSHEQRRKIKGAAYSLAVMCACQPTTIDMLMYYDARPNEFWNGMFDDMVIGRVLKGYYPFPMFNTLYQLGENVKTTVKDEDCYICAAKNDNEAAIVIARYNEDETDPADMTVTWDGFEGEKGVEAEWFLLDDTHDLQSMGKVTYSGDRFSFTVNTPNHTCYLIKLKKK